MIDDLKFIHEKDSQDALGVAEKQWQQIDYDFTFTNELDFSNISNVVFCGMGGSALAAQISTSWPGYNIPFEICRNYNIPKYVNENTLVIASSYSGNTEEVLSALTEAQAKSAKIIAICSGGKLLETSLNNNLPYIQLPSGFQPRFAVLYNLKALITVLEQVKIFPIGTTLELKNYSGLLKSYIDQWVPMVHSSNNLAKQIALDVIGKAPVIYSGPKMASVAYKWKISFNENAKNIAWCNQYPELDHNEFIGWTSHPLDKLYVVIDLKSSFEHEKILKRFEISEKLLSGKRPSPIKVNAEGDSLIKQILWSIALGDFVTIYTALLNGQNPMPVDLIEKLKTQLNS